MSTVASATKCRQGIHFKDILGYSYWHILGIIFLRILVYFQKKMEGILEYGYSDVYV